jgi:hypothetical protein
MAGNALRLVISISGIGRLRPISRAAFTIPPLPRGQRASSRNLSLKPWTFYQHAYFSADKKNIEVAVRPRKGSGRRCLAVAFQAPRFHDIGCGSETTVHEKRPRYRRIVLERILVTG